MPACLPRRIAGIALLALLTVLAATLTATAQDLQVTAPDEAVTIGKNLDLELVLPAGAGTDPGAITVTVAASEGTGTPLLEEAFPLRTGDQAGRFLWSAPTQRGAHPGDYTLTVTVTAPTGEATWTGDVTVDFGEGWNAERIAWFVSNRGKLLFFGLVFLFGILMSATPCIYPMIPITLAVIGAQTQEKGLAKGFLLSLTYGVGLALIYGIIGLVTATVFSGMTAVLQSPPVLVPIAALMVVMAFAMFGAFELEAPAFLRNKLQGAGGGRAGFIGALITGMIAGLVASPCVGPFLNGLLLWVATTGQVFLGFWSLFIFGLGLSLLLVAVGTFPSLMGSLPQSGGWMEQVKRGMGLLLLYMAFFFLRPGLVLPEHVFWPLLGAVTVVVAVFLGAFDRLDPSSNAWDRGRKALGILVLLVGVGLLAREALPRVLPAPTVVPVAAAVTAGAPATGAVAAAPLPDKVQWEIIHTGENVQGFIDEKIALAKSTGKPIVIDFWATWCAYCKKLDKKVWVEPAVVEESLRFITIKVDATDTDDEDMTGVKEMFHVLGLPTVAFIDSNGRVLHGSTMSGWHEADEFLETMRAIR